MGSIDKACISGFLCRLCSEMHRIVIHIYGDQGQRLCLVEKINGYLPITISPTDPLPKTICTTCLRRVEQHYDLLMRLSRIKEERFLRYNKVTERLRSSPISSIENSEDEVYQSDDESRRRRLQLDIPSQRQIPQQSPRNFPSSTSAATAASSLFSATTANESFSRSSFMNAASSANDDVNNDDNDSGASTSASALAAITQNVTANVNEANVGDTSSSSSTSSSSTHPLSIEAGNSFGIVLQQQTD